MRGKIDLYSDRRKSAVSEVGERVREEWDEGDYEV